MLTVSALLIVLVAHYLADFVFQTRWMATNKSSNINALSKHILEYSGILILVCSIGFWAIDLSFPNFFMWIGFNGLAHFAIDFITSKLSKNQFENNKLNQFWMTIGADQLIHQVCLVVSLAMYLN